MGALGDHRRADDGGARNHGEREEPVQPEVAWPRHESSLRAAMDLTVPWLRTSTTPLRVCPWVRVSLSSGFHLLVPRRSTILSAGELAKVLPARIEVVQRRVSTSMNRPSPEALAQIVERSVEPGVALQPGIQQLQLCPLLEVAHAYSHEAHGAAIPRS